MESAMDKYDNIFNPFIESLYERELLCDEEEQLEVSDEDIPQEIEFYQLKA